MWLKINIFLTIPCLLGVGTLLNIMLGLYTIPPEMKHIAHMEEHPKEFVEW